MGGKALVEGWMMFLLRKGIVMASIGCLMEKEGAAGPAGENEQAKKVGKRSVLLTAFDGGR